LPPKGIFFCLGCPFDTVPVAFMVSPFGPINQLSTIGRRERSHWSFPLAPHRVGAPLLKVKRGKEPPLLDCLQSESEPWATLVFHPHTDLARACTPQTNLPPSPSPSLCKFMAKFLPLSMLIQQLCKCSTSSKLHSPVVARKQQARLRWATELVSL
jgi:hypothetical protein